jgi:hypothetical protein
VGPLCGSRRATLCRAITRGLAAAVLGGGALQAAAVRAARAASLAEPLALTASGRADEALPAAAAALDAALRAGRGQDAADACFLLAEVRMRLGERNAALALLRQVERIAAGIEDPGARGTTLARAHPLALRLGDPAAAFRYLSASRDAASLAARRALPPPPLPQEDELPAVFPLPAAAAPRLAVLPPPLAAHSQRAAVRSFQDRLRRDPEYLAALVHLKEFDEYHRSPGIGSLSVPEVHVPMPTTWRDDYRIIGRALGYYRFVLKLSRTLDDTFGLAVLYVNLTFLNDRTVPGLRVVYYVTKSAAIAEAASRIIALGTGGHSLDLAILALCKSAIDIIRHYDRRSRPASEASPVSAPRVRAGH